MHALLWPISILFTVLFHIRNYQNGRSYRDNHAAGGSTDVERLSGASVANLAASGCVRFCFLTFLTRIFGFLSERTRTREIKCIF